MVIFEGLVGHHGVLEQLSQELAAPAHAYLFIGPSNVGKAMVARRFAAALLCDGDQDCFRRAVEGLHPDLTVVEPEGRASITVDQSRSVIALASRSPLEADRRVFVFEEGGMMNDEAANALLKTLEEPVGRTVFVIVAESEFDLPETVVSRCRTFVFGRVAETDVVEGLVAIGIEPDQAERAARIAGGRPGLALALATRPEVAAFRHAWLSVPMRVSAHPGNAFLLADEAMAAAEPLLTALKERQKADAESATGGKAMTDRQERELKRATDALHQTGLEILASFYRDAAAAQLGVPVRNTDVPVGSLAAVPTSTAVAHAARVLDTIDALRANQRPHLAFATLFASLGADA
jgi:DNA polymerase-3 subunit delta'